MDVPAARISIVPDYFQVGDIVDLKTPSDNYSGPFRIVAVKPVNLTIETEAGHRLRINKRGVVASKRKFTYVGDEAPAVNPGMLVQYTGVVKPRGWTYPSGQLFVALDVSRNGHVKCAKLGGEPGNLYWKFTDTKLRVIDARTLVEYDKDGNVV